MSTRESSRRGKTHRHGHTSIIYFHGMGTPRRYEELSRVLDTLDRYAEAANDPWRIGMLRGQSVGFERSRAGTEEPVAYLRFSRFLRNQADDTRGAGLFRLYESYWSPAAAGGVHPVTVLLWVLSRILTPFIVLLNPWRGHQRLKNTFLNRMFFDRGKTPALEFQRLGTAYRNFEGMGARRDHPGGRFGAFQKFMEEEASDPVERKRLRGLAERWRLAIWKSQGEVFVAGLGTIAILAAASSLLIFLLAFFATRIGLHWGWVEQLVRNGGRLPAWLVVAGGLALCGIGIQITLFLRLFLADVVFWTTTLEKDVRYQKRREILASAESAVRHVLADPDCERIVILAHSLGTAIAYDTLLSLGRKLEAERADGVVGPSPLDALQKVSHFITLGSPIDRISYFFQLSFSPYHRFNRVFDTMLGSAADLPFRDNRKPMIQWINIRDRADPISSRLFSPRGTLPNRDVIHEVEVSSSHFPEPGGAHTGYFNSTLAAKVMFDACILGRRSLQLQTRRPAWSKIWAKWISFAARLLVGLLVAGFGTGAVAYWTGFADLLLFSQAVVIATLLALVAVGVIGAVLDRLHALKLPA